MSGVRSVRIYHHHPNHHYRSTGPDRSKLQGKYKVPGKLACVWRIISDEPGRIFVFQVIKKCSYQTTGADKQLQVNVGGWVGSGSMRTNANTALLSAIARQFILTDFKFAD